LPWVPTPDRALREGGKLRLITAGPRFYDSFYQALDELIRRYPEHYGGIRAERLIGAYRFEGQELQSRPELSVCHRFHLSLEEPYTRSSISAGSTPSPPSSTSKPLLPRMREEDREILRTALGELSWEGELLAVECPLILGGIKGKGDDRK